MTTINIFVKLAKAKRPVFNVDPSMTVGDFKQQIIDKEGVDGTGVKLIYKAKVLSNDSLTLSLVGATNNCTMFAALKVLGGEGNVNRMNTEQVNKYKGKVCTIVKENNCIYNCNNGCSVRTLKKAMFHPCRCVYCPDCMRLLIEQLATGHNQIQCSSSHVTNIPLELALAIAGFNEKETEAKQSSITESWMSALSSNVKVCPNAKCKSYIFRGDNLGSVNRVRCPLCKAFDFCWFCMGKWKGSGGKKCGNNDCDMRANYIAMLQNGEIKDIWGIKNVPDTRICVNMECCAVNIHENACKRILCKCKTKYCHSCLKKWGSEKNQCNNSRTCVPAGVQEITDEMFNVM